MATAISSNSLGDWMNLHPDRILVGRAVTCAFVPIRPDFNDAIAAQGEKEGRVGGQNSWVIDTLVRDDVIVVDLFGKVKDGTFAGDNLGNSIYAENWNGYGHRRWHPRSGRHLRVA